MRRMSYRNTFLIVFFIQIGVILLAINLLASHLQ